MSEKYNQESSSFHHISDDEMETLASQLEKMPMEDDTDDDLELTLAYIDDLDLCLISHEPSKKNSLIQAIGRENSIKILTHCPRYSYASVASLSRSFHDLIRSGEIYKARSKNKVVEHWVYFSCHMLKWEAFDPVGKKWMHLPMINSGDTCFAFSDKESMGVGTDLLVLGKHVSGQAVYKYSLLSNSWSEGPTMNKPRCLFGSASLGTIAIFAGGVNANGKIMDTVESYDSVSGAWETLPSLLKPRKMSSGVFMDDKFYVIGGCGGEDMKPLSCGEEYDPVAKTWRVIPDMWTGGGGGSMAPPLLAVVDNELYAADCEVMEVKKYDKNIKVWESIGRLPESADNMCGWGMAFRGCGDRVIIVGGRWAHGEYAHVEIYSWVPKEGPPQWTMIGRKKSDNFVYNCAIMGC
ncbi:putative kelch-type beta propeller [Helianthus debilis subsp. tardiflorus]